MVGAPLPPLTTAPSPAPPAPHLCTLPCPPSPPHLHPPLPPLTPTSAPSPTPPHLCICMMLAVFTQEEDFNLGCFGLPMEESLGPADELVCKAGRRGGISRAPGREGGGGTVLCPCR